MRVLGVSGDACAWLMLKAHVSQTENMQLTKDSRVDLLKLWQRVIKRENLPEIYNTRCFFFSPPNIQGQVTYVGHTKVKSLPLSSQPEEYR